MYSDIPQGRCTFLPNLVRTIYSIVVGWCSRIPGGDVFVDGEILSSCDCVMANRCLLQWSFRPFSFRIRYDLGCSHLLISPFLTRSCHHVNGHGHRWSGGRVFCLFYVCLSWYVGFFILGRNVRNTRFISFVASDGAFSMPGAVHKASNARSLSSFDFRHFSRDPLTICIVLSTMPFDSANSGLLVSCSKFHFAKNFLNSSEPNSGPSSEKTSLGTPCLVNIAFIFFITIGEVSLRSLLILRYFK